MKLYRRNLGLIHTLRSIQLFYNCTKIFHRYLWEVHIQWDILPLNNHKSLFLQYQWLIHTEGCIQGVDNCRMLSNLNLRQPSIQWGTPPTNSHKSPFLQHQWLSRTRECSLRRDMHSIQNLFQLWWFLPKHWKSIAWHHRCTVICRWCLQVEDWVPLFAGSRHLFLNQTLMSGREFRLEAPSKSKNYPLARWPLLRQPDIRWLIHPRFHLDWLS